MICVEKEDIFIFIKLLGVGKKMVEWLVVEMKDCLKGWGVGDFFIFVIDVVFVDFMFVIV